MISNLGLTLLALLAFTVSVSSLVANVSLVGIPDNYNAADAYPECAVVINTVRDQGQGCTADWAIAAASVMSDATCINCKKRGSPAAPYLSELDLLACCPDCGNCNGGNERWWQSAFSYWTIEGLVTGGPFNSKLGCKPYSFPPTNSKVGDTPSCSNDCQAGFPSTYQQDKHKGTLYQDVSGESNMRLSLYNNGPLVVTSFKLYEDFKSYKNGIYEHKSGNLVGTHPVKLIGYGSENGQNYWLAVNSWGPNWGINGMFKIKRGNNECSFEDSAVAALASNDACFQAGQTTTTPIQTTSHTTPKPTTKAAQALFVQHVTIVLSIAFLFACFSL